MGLTISWVLTLEVIGVVEGLAVVIGLVVGWVVESVGVFTLVLVDDMVMMVMTMVLMMMIIVVANGGFKASIRLIDMLYCGFLKNKKRRIQ